MHIYSVQNVFIVSISEPYGLWPQRCPLPNTLIKWLRRIHTRFNASYCFSFPPLPLLLSGHPISSFSPPPPLFTPPYHPTTTTTNNSPPLPPAPSPKLLSQLPMELAAIQDLADGSVIRSASLHSSLLLPPLPYFFFLLFNQIAA